MLCFDVCAIVFQKILLLTFSPAHFRPKYIFTESLRTKLDFLHSSSAWYSNFYELHVLGL